MTMTRTSIVVKTSFIGFHRWKDAPEDVKYLRDFHRHVFHVKVIKDVPHDDRAIEFITFKKKLDAYLRECWADQSFDHSCEQIAKLILEAFDATHVSVCEDDENGAIVSKVELQVNHHVLPIQHKDFSFTERTVEVDREEIYRKFKELEQTGLRSFTNLKPIPVSELVRHKCFVGTEAEGPNRGTYPVLFVPGCVSPGELSKVWNGWPHYNMKEKIQRIYCGAGNLPYPRQDTIALACELVGGENVDVEVDSFERVKDVAAMFRVTVISRNPLDREKADFIKYIDTIEVRWWDRMERVYRTKLDDGYYANDKELDY